MTGIHRTSKLLFVSAACAGLALSGCGKVAAGVNALADARSAPDAAQTAANLKAGPTAFVCDVGDVAALASQIEPDIEAGSALIEDAANVYTVSSAAYTALGGSVSGRTRVPPSAATVISASAS